LSSICHDVAGGTLLVPAAGVVLRCEGRIGARRCASPAAEIAGPPLRKARTMRNPMRPDLPTPHHPLLAGALLIIAAELMFASMGAGIRQVSLVLPNASIVFFRNVIGVGLLLPWLWHLGIRQLRTAVPHLHVLRSLAGLGAMYCFFYAIAHIALAEAMLLKMTAPLFMPFVALAWLGEPIPGRVLAAVLLGFLGVALIVSPQPGIANPVALIAVLGGLLAALAKVTVRRLSRTEPTLRIVFYFAIVGTLVSAFPLLWTWRTPSGSSLLWMLAVGCFATIGQLLLTRGLALAPAGRLGVFAYSSAVFGAAYGWIFWHEAILWSTAAGAILVALAGAMAGKADKAGAIRVQPSPS